MRIQILDPHWKKMDPEPDPGYFFELNFFNKAEFSNFSYFYAKTLWTIQKSGNCQNLSFFYSSNLGFESKHFFLQFLVDILPLGAGSVDPNIFADLDPGSKNLAGQKNPDPKHWLIQ